MERNPEIQKITGYHEAGHTIVRQALQPDVTKAGLISILPGVAMIGEEWVHYAGIAWHEKVKESHIDRRYILEVIAEYAGGDVAERLVTRGEKHTAGKSNDMERATQLAQRAILVFGLSQAWGIRAIPQGMDLHHYLESLSENDKLLLQQEVQKLVNEGHELARQVLEANFHNALIPLGNLLAEKGILTKEEVQDFYRKTPLNREPKSTGGVMMDFVRKLMPARASATADDHKILRKDILSARQVADIDAIVRDKKQKQFNEVPLPEKLPVGSNAAYDSRHTSCKTGLTKKAG